MIADRILSVADNRDPESMASRLRARRFRKFAEVLRGADEPVRILDIGGAPAFWQRHHCELPVKAEITLLNRGFGDLPGSTGFKCVVSDARRLDMFKDLEFDMCFSNSVIEHVGDADDQLRMAQEVRRVSRGYFVQTPNKYFPLEPHFLVPGWQFAPLPLRAWLLRRKDRGWVKRVEDREVALATVRSIRLLSARGLRALFPDATICLEKIGPVTKSIIAIPAALCDLLAPMPAALRYSAVLPPAPAPARRAPDPAGLRLYAALHCTWFVLYAFLGKGFAYAGWQSFYVAKRASS